MPDKFDYIIFPYSRSLLILGIVSAILAPIVGFIMGIYFWRHPQLAREGRVILAVVGVWILLVALFTLI